MVSAASCPHLQENARTGHPQFRNGEGNQELKGWATRPRVEVASGCDPVLAVETVVTTEFTHSVLSWIQRSGSCDGQNREICNDFVVRGNGGQQEILEFGTLKIKPRDAHIPGRCDPVRGVIH